MPVAQPHGRGTDREPTYLEELLEVLRILVVAGVGIGIVVIGLGSRLAMFVLRATSPSSVIGVRSDDGFLIGRTTLEGTYNLVLLGAVLGFLGAAAYVAVAPWLIGPAWFRRLTVGLTAGVLVGSAVIVPGGVDFTRLEPRWLAVALFVGLPVLSGVALSLAVDAVAAPGSRTARGAWRWLLPLLLLAVVPLAVLPMAAIAVVVAVLLVLRRLLLRPILASPAATLGVRSLFFLIPVLSTVALGQDLAALF